MKSLAKWRPAAEITESNRRLFAEFVNEFFRNNVPMRNQKVEYYRKGIRGASETQKWLEPALINCLLSNNVEAMRVIASGMIIDDEFVA
jgi:hypothetical protein